MSEEHFDCTSCIQNIREGGKKREEGIKQIYQAYFPFVAIHSKQYRNQLSQEEVLDAYTDSVLAFMYNILSGKYQEEGNCRAYLKRIHRNKCVSKIRGKPDVLLEELGEWLMADQQIHEQLSLKEDYERLICYISHLEEGCQSVLLYKYYWEYKNTEIAKLMEYKNANTVGSKAFTCRQQLVNLMKNPEIEC